MKDYIVFDYTLSPNKLCVVVKGVENEQAKFGCLRVSSTEKKDKLKLALDNKRLNLKFGKYLGVFDRYTRMRVEANEPGLPFYEVEVEED